MELRDDPAFAERLGQAGRRLLLDAYTWDARAAAILDGHCGGASSDGRAPAGGEEEKKFA